MNKKYHIIAGLFGVICFVCGVTFFLVKRELSAYVLINALAGIALMAGFLYFNVKEGSRVFTTADKKGSRNVILQAVLILGIVAALNLVSSLFYFGKDLTSDKVSSISDHSQKVITWIKQPVEILVFGSGEDSDFQKFLLDSYNFYNKRITYRFMDPERNPQLAQEYGVTRTGQAVIKYNNSHLLIESVTEEAITNAIIKMTQSVKNYVYFMMGHGEHIVDDFNNNQGYGLLWKEMKEDNYLVFKLKLEPPNYYIPGNCTILVVAGPRRMFTEMEKKAIREYMENGGRAVFMLDPNVQTGLESMVADYGIKLEDDCMADVVFPSIIERALARMSGRRASPRPILQVMVKDFPEHEITQNLKEKAVIMAVTRSLTELNKDKPKMDLQVETIAKTTDKGWGETDLEGLFKYGHVSGGAVRDRKGPLIVSMLATKGTKEANSKLLVFGGSNFVNNEFLNQLFNRDFFMNSMAYLSKQATLISVRPRHLFSSRLDYDPVVMSRIFTASVLIFPQLFLMIGVAIWWLRR